MRKITFTEDEILDMVADSDGSNLRIHISLDVIVDKIKTPKVSAPAPYQTIDEMYAVFIPKFAKFGVQSDLVKMFLNLNCNQTKSGKRSITKLLSMIQDLLALANLYGPKLNEALGVCTEPRHGNVPYVKKILKNRTKMAQEKEVAAQVASDRVKKNEANQDRIKTQGDLIIEARRKKENSMKALPAEHYQALEAVATRQLQVEWESKDILGGNMTIKMRMVEVFESLPMDRICEISKIAESVPISATSTAQEYADRLIRLGMTIQNIAKGSRGRYVRELSEMEKGADHGKF